MADIRDEILRRYDIDIKTDKLLKMYKITSADIPASELDKKLKEQRKKWDMGANSPNDMLAEKSRAYLDKAARYEQILRDPKLFSGLFAFYNGGDQDVSKLVKRYFSLIHSTTKIGNHEVSFFLKYFKEENKNRSKILKYLKDEYKVNIVLSKEERASEEPEDDEKNKKERSSGLIENNFREQTVLDIRKCENKFLEAKQKATLIAKYPALEESLYEFLEIGKFKDAKQYRTLVEQRKNEYYSEGLDRAGYGDRDDFNLLVDLFNKLFNVLGNKDVQDNFEEFKLLIMYPALTPYMYEIREIKKDSLNELYSVASSEYNFGSMANFVCTYFDPVYDNFGIYANSIKKLIADAKKQGGREKRINALYEFIGFGRGKALPAELRWLYYLAYWPVILFAYVFRAIRFVIDQMRYIGIALGGLWTLITIITGPQMFKETDFFTNFWHWGRYISDFTGIENLGFFTGIFASLLTLIGVFFMYFGIGLFIAYFFWELAVEMRKKIDLKGLARSVDALLDTVKSRLVEQHEEHPNNLFARKLPLIVSNIALVVLIVVICLG